MHLSEAGFRELIIGRDNDWRILEFDSETWPDKWQNYLFTAKRWDDRKLVDVFGATDSGDPRATVRDPFKHCDNLADSDRRLVGEFIRNNHHRMAHEFAVFGVPGPSGEPIRPEARFGLDLCDVAGLVARSHGMPVRACFDYLCRKYHRREYQGVHAVYLMTLLRVADYLQIQPDRSSSVAFRYKHIPSPISVQEHKAHQAIKNITQTHDDPESIEIQALPEDVSTFLRVKDWLAGIQSELDASWAVLGEVYGAHKGLCKLGLIIRRVRSNLDDVETFARSVQYVPQRLEFDVARAELLTLLVRPLYGNCPEIGIRELVQNAVDAVRERIKFQEHHPEFVTAELLDQASDVIVSIDDDPDDHAVLTVSDRGIGMTAEVIRDFFLKVGASFRKSQSWQREFEVDQSDEESSPAIKSQVLRSGRFGIGALAVFLLGKEIEVETRHLTSSKGIYFKTSLDRGPIQLDYRSNLAIGTTIRVRIPVRTSKELCQTKWYQCEEAGWDWYCLQRPSVRRVRCVEEHELPQEWTLSHNNDPLPADWHSIGVPGFEAIHWTYSHAPELTCNGIRVIEAEARPRTTVAQIWRWSNQDHALHDLGGFHIRVPNLSVFDPDGNLPLNLQRTKLDREQFGECFDALLQDVLNDLMAFMLAHVPTKRSLDSLLQMPLYSGLTAARGYGAAAWPWIATKDGVAIADSWILQQLKPRRLLHVVTDVERVYELEFGQWVDINSFDAVIGSDARYDLDSRTSAARCLIMPDEHEHRAFRLETNGVRVVTTRELLTTLKKRLPQFIKRALHEEWSSPNGNWVSLTRGDCPTTAIRLDNLNDETLAASDRRSIIAEWFLAEEQPEAEMSPIALAWCETIDSPVIPYSKRTRKKLLSRAYQTLHEYIDVHEAARKESGRSKRSPKR